MLIVHLYSDYLYRVSDETGGAKVFLSWIGAIRSGQLIQQSLGVFQIGSIEAFGEPIMIGSSRLQASRLLSLLYHR